MEDGPAKPNPFPVVRAAELMGVDPKNTALVRSLARLLARSRASFVVVPSGGDVSDRPIFEY